LLLEHTSDSPESQRVTANQQPALGARSLSAKEKMPTAEPVYDEIPFMPMKEVLWEGLN
jgi:hypothetical protein